MPLPAHAPDSYVYENEGLHVRSRPPDPSRGSGRNSKAASSARQPRTGAIRRPIVAAPPRPPLPAPPLPQCGARIRVPAPAGALPRRDCAPAHSLRAAGQRIQPVRRRDTTRPGG